MTSFLSEQTAGILAQAPVVEGLRLRLYFLTKLAGTTFTRIERDGGLGPKSISGYVRGQGYAYPKLRRVVCEQLAAALDESVDDVRAYLFDDATATALPAAAAARGGP